MNVSTFKRKLSVFSGLFFTICVAANAADFAAQYAKLSAKEKTLLRECSTIYKASTVSAIWFSEQPVRSQSSDQSVNAWSALDVAQWNSTYGPATGTVLTITIDSTNRFGEVIKKRLLCGWRKGNYEMLFPSYLTDISGNATLMEREAR
jgi:hypothetical protein